MTSSDAQRLLDHPIWSSLTTRHAHLALGGALARRYPPDISPLTGLPAVTPGNVAALEGLVAVGDDAAIFGPFEPTLPENWETVHAAPLVQMIRVERAPAPETSAVVTGLGADDAADMLALIELTQPGPFRRRTFELGSYIGIRVEGRLVAMAGERMGVPGFREVSAVCTHPQWRGRGLARALIARVVNRMLRAGDTPFLHVEERNVAAIATYRALGFASRARFALLAARRIG